MRTSLSTSLCTLVLVVASACHGLDPNAVRLATDLAITEVAIHQGVAIPLSRNGVLIEERNAPVIVEREAMVRVFVAPTEAYVPRALTAELMLDDLVLTDTRTIEAASTDEALDSTFHFAIPAGRITRSTRWSIAIRDPDAPLVALDTVHGARSPTQGGTASLGAVETGRVRVMLVPFAYDADGSGRLPDTSAAQLELFRQSLYAMFPAAGVDLTVHAPVAFPKPVTASSGLDPVDFALIALRADEQPDDDLYYFGLINPAPTFAEFCARGCTKGRSHLESDPFDASLRVGAGIGFTGVKAADTFVHELGHLHGRRHAPCKAGELDTEYPYPRGEIGVWGWDVLTSHMLPPTTSDFMSYCDPSWVSDYTYRALAERMIAVNGAAGRFSRTLPSP